MKKSFAFILMLLMLITQGARAENPTELYFVSGGIRYVAEIYPDDFIDIRGYSYNYPYILSARVCAPDLGYYAGDIEIPASVLFPGADIKWEGYPYNDGIYPLPSQYINVEGCVKGAFEDCPWLESVTFPEPNYLSHFASGGISFKGCPILRTVKNMDLTGIGPHQFENCYLLETINLSKTKYIGDYAFKNCNRLKNITLWNLEYIGDYAFSNCKSLISVEFKNNFRPDGGNEESPSKGEGVFSGCSSLTEVKGFDHFLPTDDRIGDKFFYHCYSLKEIKLNEYIKIIGKSAFEGCNDLTAIYSEAYKSGLNIEERAFYDCKKLIFFSGWIASAEEYAFGNCEQLGSIVWCSDEGDLKRNSFYGCKALDRLTLKNQSGSKNHKIEYGAFSGCYSIEDIFHAGVTEFPTCESGAFPCSIEDKYATLFAAYKQDDEYNYEFRDKHNPWSHFTHQDVAYYDEMYWNLGEAGIFCREKSPHIINGALVQGVYYIDPMIDGKYVTGIGYKAFKDNQRLTTVGIYDYIQKIEGQVFRNCSMLTGIYVYWATPLLFDKNLPEDSQPFAGVDFDKVTLYVPKGCKEKYQVANEWKRFTNIVEGNYVGRSWSPTTEDKPHSHVHNHRDKTENVISFLDPLAEEICIGKWDANDSGFLSEKEAANVSELGLNFKGSEITSFCELSYFTGLNSIAQNELAGCAKLDSITFPMNITAIGDEAFSGCNSLKKVFTNIQNPRAFNDNVFTQAVYDQALLVVPVGTVKTYKATAGWKNFKNIVEKGSEPEENEDPENPNEDEKKECDLNGDGEVNNVDLEIVLTLIMNGKYETNADINRDGVVNVADVVELVKIINSGNGTGSGYFWMGNYMPKSYNFPTLNGKEVEGIVTTYTSPDDAMAKASRAYSAGEYAIVMYPLSWGVKDDLVFLDSANKKYYATKQKNLPDFPDYLYYESTDKIGANATITLSTEVAAKAAGATLFSKPVL